MDRLPDLTDAQALAAVETAGRSIALTSGAGCGKTLVLARRFTTLLLAGDDGEALQRLVALTFTDKAAAEMLRRVRRVLTEALAATDDPARRERLAEWITELPAARISTIHSFCGSLLRRYAVEAGVDPGFAVCADELLAGQMLSDAVEGAVLAEVESAPPPLLDLLARADLGRVIADVEVLVARRPEWRAGDYADPEETVGRWRRLQEELRESVIARLRGDSALHEELAELQSVECTDPSDKLAVYRDEQLAIIDWILNGRGKPIPADLEGYEPSPGNAGSAKAWGGAEARTAFRRRLKKFVGRFAALAMWFEELGTADEQAARDLAALTHLAGRANEVYARAKRAEGMLDFDDLIDLSARLLRARPDVRERLRSQVGQFLIDECQDTDAGQLTMLWDMLSDDGKKAPAGRLFVVGDVKQSIYRFRGARAEVFERLCGSFGDDRVSLTESFRTHRAGAAFVNHLFRPLMGGGYEPIVSARRECPEGPAVEILLAAVGEDDNTAEAVAAQARVTASRIAEMIGTERRVWDREAGGWRKVRPGDVAILFARMTQSLEYERALQDWSVPYYVVAGTGFFRQQEVYDVLNALQAIDNPHDDVALVGTLRGAMFALDDNALLHLAEAAGTPYFRRLTDPGVLARLAPAARERMVFAAGVLGRLHADKDALGPARLIESLLAATGYEQVLLSEFNGRQKLGNLRRMLDAARGASGLSPAEFVRQYGQFVLAESRHEQAAVAGEDEDVVRLMTIHKAKGLEFPVVFVPDLNAGARGPAERALLFRDDWGVTFRPPAAADDEQADGPLVHRLARESERADMQAEDVRKLYVAVTRHQDHLVLVGADYRTADGGFRSSNSYLGQLDAVLHLADRLQRGEGLVPYGADGERFDAVLARVAPAAPAWRMRIPPVGQDAVVEAASAGEVVEDLYSAAADDPAAMPLLAPLPDRAGGTIAATALGDFLHCPMLYRWRYELRVPDRGGRGAGGSAGGAAGAETGLDAATLGTVLHRCMELADLTVVGLSAQAGPLVARVLAEMDLHADRASLSAELAGMLDRFERTELLASIRGGRRVLRELSFLLDAGGLKVAGQIDLLFQDAEGGWHVVDYKSDRVGPDEIPAHAERYGLQMALYMAAAARQLGGAAPDATLYFLRPGVCWRIAPPSPAAPPDAPLAAVVADLARCRRTGIFGRRDDRACPGCPCQFLCQRPHAQNGVGAAPARMV